jgi:hypothetical protein
VCGWAIDREGAQRDTDTVEPVPHGASRASHVFPAQTGLLAKLNGQYISFLFCGLFYCQYSDYTPFSGIVDPPYERGCVIFRAANRTEQNLCVRMFEFPHWRMTV